MSLINDALQRTRDTQAPGGDKINAYHSYGGLPAIVAHALHNAVTVAAMVAWPPLFDWMYPR